MTSPPFHNTIYLQGPHDPAVTWVEAAGPYSPGFASIHTSGVSILVQTVAEADALIKAAVAAKDLLLGAQREAEHVDGCGAMLNTDESAGGYFLCTRAAGHSGDHEAGGARDRSEPPLTWPQAPPLPPGHGENHTDHAGHVLGAGVPGDCLSCHGHVSATGVFTPAAVTA